MCHHGINRNSKACGSDGNVHLWNCGTSETLATWNVNSSANSISILEQSKPGELSDPLHPLEAETDGKLLFVGTESHGTQGIDIRSRDVVRFELIKCLRK